MGSGASAGGLGDATRSGGMAGLLPHLLDIGLEGSIGGDVVDEISGEAGTSKKADNEEGLAEQHGA